jgi:hypothetical protein
MRDFKLHIAGYNIGFEAAADGPGLTVSPRFLRNITSDSKLNINIKIHRGSCILPSVAERVFHAPFVEEIDGMQIHHKTNFWSIWKHNADLYITTILPLSPFAKNAVVKFSLPEREWNMWIESPENEVDPFEYPLDGLILYYLTVINGDIMIHAAGINDAGHGYLFTGESGKGKSTMAGLWEKRGSKVIHDDRLIIRKADDGYRMFNTPVYNNDEPDESSLGRIFIIDHGIENKIIPLKEASAVSLVMANCIQHTWGPGIILKLLESVSAMCRDIPTYRLYFRPEESITDYIVKNEG